MAKEIKRTYTKVFDRDDNGKISDGMDIYLVLRDHTAKPGALVSGLTPSQWHKHHLTMQRIQGNRDDPIAWSVFKVVSPTIFLKDEHIRMDTWTARKHKGKTLRRQTVNRYKKTVQTYERDFI